jgi:signal transduction histidine kinase
MHDIIGHHISVIAVQAEAAQEVLASKPEKAATAMANVADTARTALDELRQVVDVVQHKPRYDPTDPTPDLDDLDELVENVRQTGLPVRLDISGTRRQRLDVDTVVQLTVYRIVQEALTNIIKHAGPCEATVDLVLDDNELILTVADNGQGAQVHRRTGKGLGLVGMQRRAEIVGGRFEFSGVQDGGFQVQAHLPYEMNVDDL